MRSILSLTVLVVLFPTAAFGAEDADEPDSFKQSEYDFGDGSLTPTPEMWFYLQETRRHDDPKMAVRRNAEARAAQRRSRLAAMKWFGFSNQRPQANPIPVCGVYSPGWVAGLWEPYRWVGSGYSTMLVLTNQVIAESIR